MTSEGTTAWGCRFLNYGQAVADYRAAAFVELIRTEYLVLRRATSSGQQRVCVAHAGQVRHTELNSNRVREARYDGR
jgi:hypothetical protein